MTFHEWSPRKTEEGVSSDLKLKDTDSKLAALELQIRNLAIRNAGSERRARRNNPKIS